MSKIVRVGPLVLDLDASVLEMVDGPAMRVHTQGMTFGPYPEESAMYGDLLVYWYAQMDLNAYNLRQIRDDAFDPFLNGEPDTLYSMLQALPNVDDLVLGLEKGGAGMLWIKADDGLPAYVECEWQNFSEALEKLAAYKQSKEDSAAGVELP